MSDTLNERALRYSRIAEDCINQLLNEFMTTPHYFFSESDVKCRLFMMLFQRGEIGVPGKTIDGQLTWPLHTEVTYFDDNGQLLFHVDLSAVDTAFTDTFSNMETGGVRLSKGYSAKMCYFAIELKLNKRDNKTKMLRDWIKDMDKLTNIKTRNPYLTCFSILLDKKANAFTSTEFNDICNKYKQIKALYANANHQAFSNFL